MGEPTETILHFVMLCPLYTTLRSSLFQNVMRLLDSHFGQLITTVVDRTNLHYFSNCISSNEFSNSNVATRMNIILGSFLSDIKLENSIDSVAKRFLRKAWKKRKSFIHSLDKLSNDENNLFINSLVSA